jgi:nicotinate-nucleotide pyrophosphorylase (carboxylating)
MPDTLSPAQIQADVQRALDEDVGSGDLTASLVPTGRRLTATIICRESAILCGQPWVNEVLHRIAPSARVQWHLQDGQRCTPGATVLTIEGEARELLTAERSCLNFLQTLSAVATRTAQYVEAVRGTRAAILDTRKTIPGLRIAQKYAVRCGGGKNHRMGLYDAILIKENHIAAAGGVAAVLAAALYLWLWWRLKPREDLGLLGQSFLVLSFVLLIAAVPLALGDTVRTELRLLEADAVGEPEGLML